MNRTSRLRVLVYESLCAGGFGESPPASLRAEGWAMLEAVALDFAAIADVTTLLLPDLPEISAVHCERCFAHDSAERFRQLIRGHDAVVPIAPETGDVLGRIADIVLGEGRILLGCQPGAVRLTADKFELSGHWRQRGIPTPETRLAGDERPDDFPVVVKPRDGAGSQATRFVASAEAWPRALAEVRCLLPGTEFVVQQYRRGLAASVGFLVGSAQTIPLVAAEQLLSPDDDFYYRGGRMPLADDLAHRANELATAAIAGIDGLSGYVGVDLVLGDDGRDFAIEINPRVTTSYVGYRELCRDNLAAAWLRLAEGASDVELTWLPGNVRFEATGA